MEGGPCSRPSFFMERKDLSSKTVGVFINLVMSSGSGFKNALISFVLVGAFGMLIRYIFGGESNRSAINEIFMDVVHVLWWIIRYILLPVIIISLIAAAFPGKDNKK